MKPHKCCKLSVCLESLSAHLSGSQTEGLGLMGKHWGASFSNGLACLGARAASSPWRDGEDQRQSPRLLDHSLGAVFWVVLLLVLKSSVFLWWPRQKLCSGTHVVHWACPGSPWRRAVWDPPMLHSFLVTAKWFSYMHPWGFPYGQRVKNSPILQETQETWLLQEDSLEKGMATHSSILSWETPWTEEPGRLQVQRIARSWTRSN